MTGGAPIELYGYHDELDVILARRDGEPDFSWVQDIDDASQAAGSRGVDVVVTRGFWEELLANADLSQLNRNGLRVI